MKLPTVLWRLLLILVTFGFAVGKEQHEEDPLPNEKQPYWSDYVPTYSRHTPFMEEDDFPEPVFGIAHGLPYDELIRSHDKDDSQYNSSESSKQQDEELYDPEEMERDLSKARAENKQSIDEYIPRKLRKSMKPFVSLPQSEYNEFTDSEESFVPAYRPQGWKGELKGRGPEEPQTLRQRYGSEEEALPRQRKSQRVSFAEDNEEQKRRPPQQRHRRPPTKTPNEHTLSENGRGTESAPLGGRRYRDSGEWTGPKRELSEGTMVGQNKEIPRGTAGKVIGVDMQMVAGVYPQKVGNRGHGRNYPGRYSPLSGPFPGRDEEDERSKEPVGSRISKGKNGVRAKSPHMKAGSSSTKEVGVAEERRNKHGSKDVSHKEHGDSRQRKNDKGFIQDANESWQQSETREKLAARPNSERIISKNSRELPVVSRKVGPESRYSAPNREIETYQTSSVPTVILKKNEYARQEQEIRKSEGLEKRTQQSPRPDVEYSTQEQQSTYARRPLAYANESGQRLSPKTDNQGSVSNTALPPRTSPSSSLPSVPTEPMPTPSHNFRDLHQDERVDLGVGAGTPNPASYDENVTTTSSSADNTWTYANTPVVVSSTLLINTDRPI